MERGTMNVIFDACALIAFLRHEQGAEVIRQIFRDNQNTCYVHVINLCEVFYDFRRQIGESAAQQAIQKL
jgi:PIN domain nuclease of toxin-antitoxin system